jgi:hypothetical protein
LKPEEDFDEHPKAWIDSSDGFGEFKTNSLDYAYFYLMMPKTVDEIARTLRWMNNVVGHPLYTVNN